MKRPIKDVTVDGRKIIYPIWREDLAEALILEKKKEKQNDRRTKT